MALLTLNRPEKRNALSIELRFEIAEAFEQLADDDDVVCLILTGAGSAFCSGMDTGQFGGDAENRRLLVESSAAAFEAWGGSRSRSSPRSTAPPSRAASRLR